MKKIYLNRIKEALPKNSEVNIIKYKGKSPAIECKVFPAFSGKTVTGMSYSYTGAEYRNLFSYGDTEEEVKEKACKIWIEHNIDRLRKQYRKYARKRRL